MTLKENHLEIRSALKIEKKKHMSSGMRFQTMWYVQSANLGSVCAYTQSGLRL